jgi:Flp pilus assembly protein TadD
MAVVWLVLALSLPLGLSGPQGIRALQAQGRDTEALALADRLIEEHPAWELPRLEAARLRLGLGVELPRAAHDLEIAQALAPENPRAHFLEGLAREAQGRDELAEAAFGVALALRPSYDEARFRLAGLYYARGRWAEAEAHYRALAERQPGEQQPRLQLASVLEQQGRADEAEQVLLGLWEADRPSPAAGRRLLGLYERTGQADKARRLRAALEGPAEKEKRPLKPSRR